VKASEIEIEVKEPTVEELFAYRFRHGLELRRDSIIASKYLVELFIDDDPHIETTIG